MYLALRSFRQREMAKYRTMVTVTLLLGVLFMVLQTFGFQQLWEKGITLRGNVSYSFLYVIVGLHGVHVIGGVIALLLTFARAVSKKTRSYDVVPVEMMNTYWHFVDILWIYLLIFLLMIR